MKKQFIFNENEFIDNYNRLKSSRKMADLYGCDKTTILSFAKTIGYINNYKVSLNEQEKAEVISKYYTHTAKDLAEEYGVSKSLIIKTWHKANITDKKNRYIYPFDIDYFENINSYDKAYFLGLIASDGSVSIGAESSKQAIIRISLKQEDAHILETFKQYVCSKKPLSIRGAENTNYISYYCTLELVSDKMVNDLSKYGIVPQKTYSFITPDLDEQYISHYIRGYFDGDGSIAINNNSSHTPSSYKCSISGFKHNLEVIQKYLLLKNINTTFIADNRKTYESGIVFGNLTCNTIADVYKFLKYIYNNCGDTYIPRKKYRYDCFIHAIKMNFGNKANMYNQLLSS